MSDFEFGPHRVPRICLISGHLALDPQVMQEIQVQMEAAQMLEAWLNPDWELTLVWQGTSPQQPLFPASGRRTPAHYVPPLEVTLPNDDLAVAVTTLLLATYKLPEVQRVVKQIYGEMLEMLRRGWANRRALMISGGVLVLATSLAGILVPRTRQLAYDLMKGHDFSIDIPEMGRFSGLSVQFRLPTPPPSGAPRGTPPDWYVGVNFDFGRYLNRRWRPSRSRSLSPALDIPSGRQSTFAAAQQQTELEFVHDGVPRSNLSYDLHLNTGHHLHGQTDEQGRIVLQLPRAANRGRLVLRAPGQTGESQEHHPLEYELLIPSRVPR